MRSSGRTLTAVLASIAAFGCTTATARAAAEPPPPPGANVACKPSAQHPRPVVLVHGTAENRLDNWGAMAPALKAAGYCVYAFDYGAYDGSAALGVYGLGPIAASAGELRTDVDSVLRQTGASRVDLVGHSQGGMMPRYYVKQLGGASKVGDLVGISPSNHGTTNPLAPPLGLLCPACAQQAAGSSFITALNRGDETPGPVAYTTIATRYDEVVTPYTSDFLSGPNTTNVLLQDVCPGDTSEHLRTPYDPPAIQITLNALGRSGPADPAYKPACV